MTLLISVHGLHCQDTLVAIRHADSAPAIDACVRIRIQ